MTKREIIERLMPKCNGYDLPLSLNIALIADMLSEDIPTPPPSRRDELIHFKEWEIDNDIKNLTPEKLVDFYIDEMGSTQPTPPPSERD